MPAPAPPALDGVFAALADPTRRAIVQRLARGEATVLELAAPFAMSQPAISKHLAVLERAGLASRRKQGRHRWCRLEPAPLAAAVDWLEAYRQQWESAFTRLDTVLAALDTTPAAGRSLPPSPERTDSP